MKWGIAKLPLGFVVAATYVPGGYMDSVRHDVPGLRRRGLYHLDYAGMTLRGNRPAKAGRRRVEATGGAGGGGVTRAA